MLASRWATPPAADSAKPDAAQPQHQTSPSPPSQEPAETTDALSSTRDGYIATENAPLEQPTPQHAPSSIFANTTAAAALDASLSSNNFAAAPAPAADAPAVYSLDPMADEFAQTREDDDLFDDDFTPVAEPVVEVDLTPVPVVDDDVTDSPSDVATASPVNLGDNTEAHHHASGPVDAVPRPPPTGPSAGARGARDGGFRGRGRGNHRGARGGARGGAPTGGPGGLAGSRFAPSAPANGAENKEKEVVQGSGSAEVQGEQQGTTDGQEGEKKDAAGKAVRKEGAVRGDRSATGGIKKERLTEEQLAARMSAIKLKNESLIAAHARAEADLAQYQKREAEAAAKAAQRAKAERQNRQVMMGERERNRMRKLNAVNGREWDLDKEEGFGGTERGARGARRGAHGGVVGSRGAGGEAEVDQQPASSDNHDRSHAPQHSGGRGGRGGRRGGGRRASGGGGGGNHVPSTSTSAPQSVPTAADFPELPVSNNATAAAQSSKTDNTAAAAAAAAAPQLSFPNSKETTTNGTTAANDRPAAQKEVKTTEQTDASKKAEDKVDDKAEEKRPDPPARMESFGISELKGTSWADQVDGEE
ncbi:uncharacterized protein IWZ02DRAFT_437965 [Phyllosticta citriasiana]|uniref:Uncharacterized protein n=1 Tax=Phyllosticta citriasiana TaxID=595635 RepID=A0ABR1KAP3_9PEZI